MGCAYTVDDGLCSHQQRAQEISLEIIPLQHRCPEKAAVVAPALSMTTSFTSPDSLLREPIDRQPLPPLTPHLLSLSGYLDTHQAVLDTQGLVTVTPAHQQCLGITS